LKLLKLHSDDARDCGEGAQTMGGGAVIAALRRQWPLVTVLMGIVVALIFVAADRFRVGSVLLAASVVYAFGLRAVLSDSAAGMLVVRRRFVDLLVLGFLGVGLTVMAFWVPPPQ